METTETFLLREAVVIELVLQFCNQKVALEGEVVHVVPPEMAGAGGRPGIAVQFRGAPSEVSRKLEPLIAACGKMPQPQPKDSGRRMAPRVAARVPVRVDGKEVGSEGTTRNLSQTGVLVAVAGDGLERGQRVHVTMEHPTTGEAMEVQGTVVRQIETAGDVAALGIEFDSPDANRPDVARFVEQVQSIEHTRRLGGITGPIEELGPLSLLQMFGGTATEGTLVLTNGDDEGVIGFEAQLLRNVQLGSATGMKALVRLLSWQNGSFEFFSRLEHNDTTEAPLPLEAALFDAVRQIDEAKRIDRSRLPDDATVVAAADAAEPQLGQDSLSKIEAAVIDLARAGFTILRIIDVIPEPDLEILRALESLADRGVIRFEN
ncbi:MAG: PilZ domain-containing protein [Deltaproteobacteria bacterium]|nr:PilZ domain-containing protein [Deltaproteobacteria bacterium]MBW2667191.1 PilZ domain-containing protein [Deltaproteobacteria bacterium]